MAGHGTAHLRPAADALLRIEDLVVEFPVGRTGLRVHAVSGVSIDVLPGETLGLVGESGCGKSTMGKAVMQLVHAQSGSVLFEGNELTSLSGDRLRATRPKLQMIFQDPISSLNPRRRVRDIVREGLDIWKIGDKASRATRVDEVLDTVGIDPEVAGPKRPHEFSGGQCQRISIARAVATEPRLIICDEPVSALDVSVQAQILNLLEDMKRTYGLTLVFIAHDLGVVKNVSDKVAVMYLGKLCEFAQPDVLYAQPAHPYTAALLSAIPEPDPDAHDTERAGVSGEIASPVSPPSGCRFRTRCPRAEDRCATDEPLMREVRTDHFVACHFPLGEITVAAASAAAGTAPTNGQSGDESGTRASAPAATAPGQFPTSQPSVEGPVASAAITGGLFAVDAHRDDEPGAPVRAAVTRVDPVPLFHRLGTSAGAPGPAMDPLPVVPPNAPVPSFSAEMPTSPAPAAGDAGSDDSLTATASPSTPPSTPPASVDWITRPDVASSPVVEQPEPAPPAADELAGDELAPPASAEPSIPDVTSNDTLLPDRTRGGTIRPARR